MADFVGEDWARYPIDLDTPTVHGESRRQQLGTLIGPRQSGSAADAAIGNALRPSVPSGEPRRPATAEPKGFRWTLRIRRISIILQYISSVGGQDAQQPEKAGDGSVRAMKNSGQGNEKEGVEPAGLRNE
jgi:hypothetical protein